MRYWNVASLQRCFNAGKARIVIVIMAATDNGSVLDAEKTRRGLYEEIRRWNFNKTETV